MCSVAAAHSVQEGAILASSLGASRDERARGSWWDRVTFTCIPAEYQPGYKESTKSPGEASRVFTAAPDNIKASSLTNGISQDRICLAVLLALETTLVFTCTVVLQDSF